MNIRKRVEKWDDKLRGRADYYLDKIDLSLDKLGYKIYCADYCGGYCDYDKKVLVIPAWVFDHDDSRYWIYYLTHELAHAVNCHYNNPDIVSAHGKHFMEFFKLLCPERQQKYELQYKPRNAKAAGIKK